MWDPTANTESTQDQFKTLFVSRINYDTSESKLRREFDSYGPIKSIRMVHDQKTGKPRGYAFIEYEHEKDMHSKYKPIKNFDSEVQLTALLVPFHFFKMTKQKCDWLLSFLFTQKTHVKFKNKSFKRRFDRFLFFCNWP